MAALIDIEQKSKGRGIMSKFEIHKCILYISMVMILLYAIHVVCLYRYMYIYIVC